MKKNLKYNPTPQEIIDQNINLENRIFRANKRTTSSIPPPQKPPCANNYKNLRENRQAEIDRQNEHIARKLRNIHTSVNNQHSKANSNKMQNLLVARKKIADANKRYKQKKLEEENMKMLKRLVQKKSAVKKILDKPVYKKVNADNRTLITDISKIPFKYKYNKNTENLEDDKNTMNLIHELFLQDSGISFLFQIYNGFGKIKVYIYRYASDMDYTTHYIEYEDNECKINRESTF